MKNTCDNTLKSLPNEVLPALGILHVGQSQFGNITKWKNYKMVRYQFGNFTMGVNNKKVNRYGEFVTERAPSDEDRWKSKNENDSVPPSPLSCRAFPAIPICLVLASGSNHHLLLNKTPSVYFFWGRKGRKMNYYKTSFDTPPYEWHRGKTQQLKDYKAVVGAKWFDNWETDHLSFVWLWDWLVQMSTRADSLLVRVRNSDAG